MRPQSHFQTPSRPTVRRRARSAPAARSELGPAAQNSELDAQASGRADVLGRLIPVREAAIHVRDLDAGIEVDALDWAIVNQEGNEVGRARARATVDARNNQTVPVGLN